MRAAYNETPFASGGKGGFGLASYTEHYGLHQWEATDDFLRTDFNTDFAKIDAGMGATQELAEGKCSIVAGSYVGDGTVSRFVDLGFAPAAVLAVQGANTFGDTTTNGGLLIPQFSNTNFGISGTGFYVSHSGTSGQTNLNGITYRYIAFQ